MKIHLFSTLAWSILLVCPALARDHDGDWPIREQETIDKTLPLSGGAMRVVLDNLDGYIHVSGSSRPDVHITAHKTIRAETDADLAKAKAEVNLEIKQELGSVSTYYAAPWRCNGSEHPCEHHERRFYKVSYDIDVELPAQARLYATNVNGSIQIDATSGDYEVKAVNGGVHMTKISGAGSVNTVNGTVSVRFAKNPSAACSFKSVNGSLDAWFQPNLQADLLFKTFNGGVYADFDVAPRALPADYTTEKRDGKFVYHSNGRGAARAGNGGPEFSFDTLNGSIRLHHEQ